MPRPPAKAQNLANRIGAKIDGGLYPPGTWLPSERELAEEHQVDRSTVRRALGILAERRLVILAAGTGAQVPAPGSAMRRAADDVTRQMGTWRGFHVSAMRAGRQPFTETTVSEIEADVEVGRGLGVPTGTPVLRRARRQGIVGGPPVQLSTSYLRLDLVEAIPLLREVDTGPGGMYSRMEERGYRIHFEESVTCRLPTKEEQGRLEIDTNQPVLVLWRRAYDQNNHILDLTHRVVVGDRQELVYRYDSTTA
ncbi:MAG TPA: GntR family transcriptional regulator [Pseudonocardiaceae bacterium]|nr:GntR family transcriptional regulator [Pseudonocardiaceae bacterium]